MPDKPLTVVYIVGSGRSGSTLLDLMLGSLPGVTSLGEYARLWAKLSPAGKYCGCTEPFRDCPFWSEVLATSEIDQSPETAIARFRAERFFARGRALPGLRFSALMPGRSRRRLRKPLQAREAVYRAAAAVAEATVLVDSSKSMHYMLQLRTRPGIDLKPVYLVRDSRAFVHSWTRVKQEIIRGELRGEMHQRPERASAINWARQRIRDSLVLGGIPHLTLRYEDVARDPGGAVRRTMRFAGHPELAASFDPSNIIPAHAHTVGGNPMRLSEEPLRIRLDDAWRREMPAATRRMVTAITWPWLLRYHYAGPFAR